MSYGYTFYFKTDSDVLTFPITPGELSITVGNNNEVVTLINGGDVNILKSPALTEVEFEARFPMRNYPYSRTPSDFQSYFDVFKTLKEEKKSFRFIVSRTTLRGKRTWDTNLLVSLEDMEINEDADEGDDVLITFTLKQYKSYGVKTLKSSDGSSDSTTSTSETSRSTEGKSTDDSYTVKSGDCLWNISKKSYGDATKWKKIYNANKTTIESTAKKYGKNSSSNGHWIYPGTKLTIPKE